MNFIKRTFLILSLLAVIVNSRTIYSQNLNYTVDIKRYEFDKVSETSKEWASGSSTHNIYDNTLVQISYNIHSKSPWFRIGSASLSGYIKDILNEYLDYTASAEKKSFQPKDRSDIFWNILIKPVIDNKNDLKDVIFSIERETKLTKDTYKIENFVVNENEFKSLKEIGHQRVNALIKDKTGLKLLVHETFNKLIYVTFEIKVHKGPHIVKEDKTDQSFAIEDVKTIKVPYTFDIKYENSENIEAVLEQVKPEETFKFLIKTTDLKNPVLNTTQTVKLSLIGKIMPIKHSKDELVVKLFLKAETISHGKGKEIVRGFSTYVKELSFSPDDVIEVQLPDNWPHAKIGFGRDPISLKNTFYSFDIEKQSLFIKISKK